MFTYGQLLCVRTAVNEEVMTKEYDNFVDV